MRIRTILAAGVATLFWPPAAPARADERDAGTAILKLASDADLKVWVDSSAGATGLPPDLQAAWKQGFLLLTQHRCREAIEKFDAILKARPDSVAALGNRGACRLSLHDLDGGIADLEQALAADGSLHDILDERLAQAQLERGGRRLDAGEYAGARADLGAAALVPTLRARAKAALAFVDNVQQRYDDCLRDAAEAIKADGRTLGGFANRAACLSNLGRNEDALADLDRALALDGHSVSALMGRMTVNRYLGRCKSAAADGRLASRLDPSAAEAVRKTVASCQAEHRHVSRK